MLRGEGCRVRAERSDGLMDERLKYEPERAARMLRRLESWFEEVEAERRSIPA